MNRRYVWAAVEGILCGALLAGLIVGLTLVIFGCLAALSAVTR